MKPLSLRELTPEERKTIARWRHARTVWAGLRERATINGRSRTTKEELDRTVGSNPTSSTKPLNQPSAWMRKILPARLNLKLTAAVESVGVIGSGYFYPTESGHPHI